MPYDDLAVLAQRMIGISFDPGVVIVEHGLRFFEAHSMLLDVVTRFLLVPLERHLDRLPLARVN